MSNMEQNRVLVMTIHSHNLVKKADDSLIHVKYFIGGFCTFPSHGAFSAFTGSSFRGGEWETETTGVGK